MKINNSQVFVYVCGVFVNIASPHTHTLPVAHVAAMRRSRRKTLRYVHITYAVCVCVGDDVGASAGGSFDCIVFAARSEMLAQRVGESNIPNGRAAGVDAASSW